MSRNQKARFLGVQKRSRSNGESCVAKGDGDARVEKIKAPKAKAGAKQASRLTSVCVIIPLARTRTPIPTLDASLPPPQQCVLRSTV